MKRAYFQATIKDYVETNENEILEHLQRNAWIAQIRHLKEVVVPSANDDGYILFEYAIPRMGKRADVVLLLGGVVLVLEYKVGETNYPRYAVDQAQDYALDLKNFHEGSHELPIVPVLVATRAPSVPVELDWGPDGVARTVRANLETLGAAIAASCEPARPGVDSAYWLHSGYKPTPTIIEAAKALSVGVTHIHIERLDVGEFSVVGTVGEKIGVEAGDFVATL